MTSYFNYFIRALTFKKYPLFRTVNFRYLLYNLILITLLLILPSAIPLLSTVNQINSISGIEDEIPSFEIREEQYFGESKEITIREESFIFDEDLTSEDVLTFDQHIFAGFIQDGIYIRDLQNDVLGYFYIGGIQDEDDLKAFIDRHLSSIYFYYFVYLTLQFFLMIVMAILSLTVISYALDAVSRMMKKKSRFMNWFKFVTFICIILLVPYVLIQIIFGYSFYLIILLSIPFIVHYYNKLPANRNKKPNIN